MITHHASRPAVSSQVASSDAFIPTVSTPCQDDPDMWTDGNKHATRIAVDLCATECPVREDCLAWAMKYEAGQTESHRWGIWGATRPFERAQMDWRINAAGNPR